MLHFFNSLVRNLLLAFIVFLWVILAHLALTTDALTTVTLRSYIYITILAILAVIIWLERADEKHLTEKSCI